MNRSTIKYYIVIIFLFLLIKSFGNKEKQNYFTLKRPVPGSILLKHGFGYFKNKFDAIDFYYNYEYCPEDDNNQTPIIAMGKGIVEEVWVDTSLDGYNDSWKKFFPKRQVNTEDKKDGGLIINYGLQNVYIDRTGIVYAKLSNVIPVVKKGNKVEEDTVVAKFSTFERYGYKPTLTIEIIIVYEEDNKKIFSIIGILPKK